MVRRGRRARNSGSSLSTGAALSAGRGLISLAAIQLGIVALRGVLYAIAAHRIEPNLRVARALFDVPALRAIVRFSGYTMVLHVLAVVIF